METFVFYILAIFCLVFFASTVVLIYLLFSSEKRSKEFQESLLQRYESFAKELREQDTKIAMENQELLGTLKEYNRYFIILAETLQEDSYFLRGELARRINSVSDTIPELRDFNKGLQTLETHIKAIFSTMKELKVIDDGG